MNSESIKILLIEDDRELRLTVTEFLEDRDFAVSAADSGVTGIALFEQTEPDLVITDLRMPEMDGHEVLAHISRCSPLTPLVVLSGTGNISDVVRALHMGAWDYILKPVEDLSIITCTVQRSLESARLQRENQEYQKNLEKMVEERTAKLNRANDQLQFSFDLLKESEERHRTILETAMDGFWIADTDGTILQVNDTYCSMSGYSREELLSMKIYELDAYEDIAQFQRHSETVVKSGEARFESVHRRKDGTLFPIETSVQYRSERFVVFIRDLSREKEAERLIHESESRYRSYIENAPIGVFLVDETGNYLQVNSAAEQITGYSAPELLAMSISDMVFPEGLPAAREHFEKVVTQGFADSEIMFKRKDGSARWWSVKAVRVSENRFLGFASDVTERKKTEEQIRLEQKRFQAIFSASPVGLMLLDQNTVITSANHTLSEMVLRDPSEVIGKRAGNGLSCVHSEEDPRGCGFGNHCSSCVLRRGIESVIRDKVQVHGAEIQLDLRIGGMVSPCWIRVDAEPVELDNGSKIIVAVADITKEKATEQALAAEHERLLGIIEDTRTGTWEWNIQTGETVFNERWAEIAGYTLEELQPVSIKTWEKLLHPDDAYRCEQALSRHYSGSAPYYQAELRLIHKDGSTVWVLDRGRVYQWDDEGRPVMMRGSHMDITERKTAELELHKQTEELDRYFNLSRDLLLIADTDGIIHRVNQEWESALGFTPQELKGTKFLDLVHPDDIESTLDAVAQLDAQSDVTNFVNRYASSKGDVRWLEWRANPCGKMIYAVARDITERKRVEDQIRISENRYRSLLRNLDAGVVVHASDSSIILCNPRASELLGVSAEQMNGKTALDPQWKLTDSNGKILAVENYPVSEIIRTGKSLNNVTIGVYRSSDDFVWLLVSGVPLYDERGNITEILISFIDVTHRKNAEEALIQSEGQHRFLFENMPIGIVYHGSEDQVEAANTSALKILGITWDQLIGKTSLDPRWRSIHEDGTPYEPGTHPSMVTLKTGNPVTDEVMGIYIPQEDAYRWITISSIPKFDRDGTIKKVYVSFEDITERKTAELALKKSEKNYRMLFENMTAGFALHEIITDSNGNPFDYRFLQANPAFEKLTNAETSAIIGKTVKELMPETEQYLIDSYGKVALTGEPISYQNYANEQGRWFDVWAYSPEFGQFATMFTDITERKTAELALAERESFLSTVLETSADAIWIVDTAGKIVQANKRCTEMYGYSAEELIGMSVSMIDTEDSDYDVENRISLIQKKGCIQFETVHRTKSGALIDVEVSTSWIDMRGGVVVAFCRDISERKLQEKRLQERESALSEAQEIAHLGSWILEIESGHLEWSNEIFRIFEIDPNEFPASYEGFLNAVHPHDREMVDSVFKESLKNSDSYEVGHRLLMSDGRIKFVQERCRFERDESGRSVRALGTVQDVTDRHSSEAREKLLMEQLFQSQKMEAIGQLAGGVAHDFNNMLGVILGQTEELLFDIHKDNPLCESVMEIKKAAQKSAGLTRQLLAFSRQQPMTPKSLDLSETIEGMLKMLRRLLGESVVIHWNAASEETPLYMDPGQLDQILANLCVNARDALDGTGDIWISTENVSFTENDIIPAELETGRYVRLTVRDNGCGMSEAVRQKIFEPFFTTKGIGKGTGLGLATVFGIVRQNGGSVSVASEIGKGTEFFILFPLHAVSVSEVKAESEAVYAGGTETVLIVEDEEMLLATAKKVLERYGYKVYTASNYEQAIQHAESLGDSINLLVTDVILPDINGSELSEKIKALAPAVKVLFMSGYTANIISDHGVFEQGVHFLQKPFQFEDLLGKVREALDS